MPKRREGSSPFERTILSFSDLRILLVKVTPKVTPFSLMFPNVSGVFWCLDYFIVPNVIFQHWRGETPETGCLSNYDPL